MVSIIKYAKISDVKDKRVVKFSLSDRIKSFKYAFNGLKILFKEEHNARIHLVVSVLVIAFGLFFCISAFEWLVVIMLIGLVFSVEILNSALEHLCDYVSPEWNSHIKKVKDLAAAAVFISSVVAVICGIIIFVPYIIDFVKNSIFN